MKVSVISLVTFYLSFFNTCQSTCLLCLSGRACVSEVQRAPCIAEQVNLNQIEQCPADQFCVDGECMIGAQPTCLLCGVCDSLTGFACQDRSTYLNCESQQSFQCQSGEECYPGGQPACAPLSMTPRPQCLTSSTTLTTSTSTVSSSTVQTITSTETPRTTLSETYAQEYCERRRQTGNFASPRVSDCTE